MKIKEYRLSVAMKGELTIEIHRNPVVIRFENGSNSGGIRRGGTYTTTDPEIQDELDNHEFYGSMFYCSKTKEIPDAVKPAEKPVVKAVEKPVEVKLHDKMPEEGIFHGITNSQQAKKQLLKLFPELTNAKLPNSDAIRSFADKHEITFPDWEKI